MSDFTESVNVNNASGGETSLSNKPCDKIAIIDFGKKTSVKMTLEELLSEEVKDYINCWITSVEFTFEATAEGQYLKMATRDKGSSFTLAQMARMPGGFLVSGATQDQIRKQCVVNFKLMTGLSTKIKPIDGSKPMAQIYIEKSAELSLVATFNIVSDGPAMTFRTLN
jgi:hypothetical protein